MTACFFTRPPNYYKIVIIIAKGDRVCYNGFDDR